MVDVVVVVEVVVRTRSPLGWLVPQGKLKVAQRELPSVALRSCKHWQKLSTTSKFLNRPRWVSTWEPWKCFWIWLKVKVRYWGTLTCRNHCCMSMGFRSLIKIISVLILLNWNFKRNSYPLHIRFQRNSFETALMSQYILNAHTMALTVHALGRECADIGAPEVAPGATLYRNQWPRYLSFGANFPRSSGLPSSTTSILAKNWSVHSTLQNLLVSLSCKHVLNSSHHCWFWLLLVVAVGNFMAELSSLHQPSWTSCVQNFFGTQLLLSGISLIFACGRHTL